MSLFEIIFLNKHVQARRNFRKQLRSLVGIIPCNEYMENNSKTF